MKLLPPPKKWIKSGSEGDVRKYEVDKVYSPPVPLERPLDEAPELSPRHRRSPGESDIPSSPRRRHELGDSSDRAVPLDGSDRILRKSSSKKNRRESTHKTRESTKISSFQIDLDPEIEEGDSKDEPRGESALAKTKSKRRRESNRKSLSATEIESSISDELRLREKSPEPRDVGASPDRLRITTRGRDEGTSKSRDRTPDPARSGDKLLENSTDRLNESGSDIGSADRKVGEPPEPLKRTSKVRKKREALENFEGWKWELKGNETHLTVLRASTPEKQRLLTTYRLEDFLVDEVLVKKSPQTTIRPLISSTSRLPHSDEGNDRLGNSSSRPKLHDSDSNVAEKALKGSDPITSSEKIQRKGEKSPDRPPHDIKHKPTLTDAKKDHRESSSGLKRRESRDKDMVLKKKDSREFRASEREGPKSPRGVVEREPHEKHRRGTSPDVIKSEFFEITETVSEFFHSRSRRERSPSPGDHIPRDIKRKESKDRLTVDDKKKRDDSTSGEEMEFLEFIKGEKADKLTLKVEKTGKRRSFPKSTAKKKDKPPGHVRADSLSADLKYGSSSTPIAFPYKKR